MVEVMKTFKKVLCMLAVIVLVLMMFSSVAFATDSSPGDEQFPYASWAYLGTMSGAMALTSVIVQFLKVPLDYVWKIPTRFFVYFIALLILLIAEYFARGAITSDRAMLIVFNAIIVTMGSLGTYEIIFKKIEANLKT